MKPIRAVISSATRDLPRTCDQLYLSTSGDISLRSFVRYDGIDWADDCGIFIIRKRSTFSTINHSPKSQTFCNIFRLKRSPVAATPAWAGFRKLNTGGVEKMPVPPTAGKNNCFRTTVYNKFAAGCHLKFMTKATTIGNLRGRHPNLERCQRRHRAKVSLRSPNNFLLQPFQAIYACFVALHTRPYAPRNDGSSSQFYSRPVKPSILREFFNWRYSTMPSGPLAAVHLSSTSRSPLNSNSGME